MEHVENNSSEETEDDIPEEEENGFDVVLDIPRLNAESLNMEAENISFSISVKAQLSNLTSVEIGTDIHIDKIKLDINSLEAEALFKVKLKKIESIFLKALESLDEHPKLLKYANKKPENRDGR